MSAPLSRASSGLEFATIAPDRSCSTELPAARSEFAYPLISTNRVDEFRDHPLGDLAASANRRPSLKPKSTTCCSKSGATENSSPKSWLGRKTGSSSKAISSRWRSLTHEFLALMLGVRRETAGVTEALQSLKRQKLIDAGRNQIIVLNRKGFERLAGKAYGTPEREYRRLIG